MVAALNETDTDDQELILKIRVDRRADLDAMLDAGVNLLRKRTKSLDSVRGILVTRHSPSDFTLEIHPDVPFGTTREKQEW